MLRRHSWFIPARTSSSVRGVPSSWVSGMTKLYCGWPAAKPPSTACGRQPSSWSWDTTRGPGLGALERGHVGQPVHALVGDALLDLRGAPAAGDDGRAHPDAEGALPGQVAGHRREPGSRSSITAGVPVEDRALGEVGEVALEPRELAVEHQRDADEGLAVVPAEGLGAPLGLDLGPARGLQEARARLGGDVRGVLGGRDGPDGQGGRSRHPGEATGAELRGRDQTRPPYLSDPCSPPRRDRGAGWLRGLGELFTQSVVRARRVSRVRRPGRGPRRARREPPSPAAAAAAATASRTAGHGLAGHQRHHGPAEAAAGHPRAERAAGQGRASTTRSTTGTEFSKSSRIEACEAVMQRPDGGQVAAAGQVDAVEDPLVLGEHVPGPSPGLVVGERGQRGVDVLDLAQRGDAELAGRPLAGRRAARRSRRRPARGGVRVDDEEGQAGGVEVARHRLDGEVAGVEEGEVPGPGAQDRGLVEEPGGGADVLVLGALDEQGELVEGDLLAGEAEQRQRDGALEGVARRRAPTRRGPRWRWPGRPRRAASRGARRAPRRSPRRTPPSRSPRPGRCRWGSRPARGRRTWR